MISKACRVNIVDKFKSNISKFKWIQMDSNGIQMEFKWTNAVFYYVFGHFHDLEGGPLKMMTIHRDHVKFNACSGST